MIEPPRGTTAEEFPQLVELLNRVFAHHVAPGIEVVCPTFIRAVPQQLDNLRIIREDGKIVSHAGIRTQELVVGADAPNLKQGFIGAVATDENHRGRGHAARLMNDAARKLREEAYDLSFLCGFRDYYEKFGWETGGGEFSFMMFQRCIRPGMKAPAEVRPCTGGASDIDAIHKAHESEPLRVRRPLEDARLLMEIPEQQIVCARRDDRFAYVVVRSPRWNIPGDLGKQGAVVDFGGPLDMVLALLDHLFTAERYGFVWVHAPASPHPFRDPLLRIAQECYRGALVNLRVIHLRGLLEKMTTAMTRRLRDREAVTGGTLTFDLADPLFGRERVTLTLERDGVGVGPNGTGMAIELDPLRLVNLLFGLDIPSRCCPWLDPRAARLLDQLFPLDFYAHKIDFV